MMRHNILCILGLLAAFPAAAYEVEGCQGDCDPCMLRGFCVIDGYIDDNGTIHMSRARKTTIGNTEYICSLFANEETCRTRDEWVKVLTKQDRECKAYQARMEKECEKYKQTDEYKARQEAMNNRYSLSNVNVDFDNNTVEYINAERDAINNYTSKEISNYEVIQTEDKTPLLGKAQNKLNELGSELLKKIF
uniref:hypothetical protein n=1 Tax=Candidatus Scatocola faecipullorum TaxID=2840917 RepID=UPI004029CF53